MSVTAPRGFVAAGVSAGLKAGPRPDLGLLFSERPAAAAGLFTRNALPAAPVVIGRRRLEVGTAQAVVVNSGQANAGTGDEGLEDAAAVSTAVALALSIDVDEVLPCSTGVIGPRIDVVRASEGVRAAAAALSPSGGDAFAEAILTTDGGPKQVIVDGEGGFVVGGCAKGAGMIAPDLATLLVFLTTDAAVSSATASAVLRRTAAPIWNGVTVDGCSSTNDTVLLMANGASGVEPAPEALAEAISVTCTELARRLVSQAEGATTTLVVQVDGAATDGDARTVGRAVAGSLLVKTAVFGRDPNPGRILQAIGASGVRLKPWALEAHIGNVAVIHGGRIPEFSPEACAQAMKEREVVIRVNLGGGPGSATAFGCDLGYEYVRINAEYTT